MEQADRLMLTRLGGDFAVANKRLKIDESGTAYLFLPDAPV
jgi:hypothetical protein